MRFEVWFLGGDGYGVGVGIGNWELGIGVESCGRSSHVQYFRAGLDWTESMSMYV